MCKLITHFSRLSSSPQLQVVFFLLFAFGAGWCGFVNERRRRVDTLSVHSFIQVDCSRQPGGGLTEVPNRTPVKQLPTSHGGVDKPHESRILIEE